MFKVPCFQNNYINYDKQNKLIILTANFVGKIYTRGYQKVLEITQNLNFDM